MLHGLIYTAVLTAFFLGINIYNEDIIKRTVIVFVLVFLSHNVVDAIFSKLIYSARQKGIDGTNIPNIGTNLYVEIDTFVKFSITYYLITSL